MEQENFDVSGEFQNYVIEKEEQTSHGVVIPKDILKTEELSEPLMIWNVLHFGWTCSPYFTLRMLERLLELCISDNTDTDNPFHWHHV